MIATSVEIFRKINDWQIVRTRTIKFHNKNIEICNICLDKHIHARRSRDRLRKFSTTSVDGERGQVTLQRITLCNHYETLSKAIESPSRNSLRLSRRTATFQSDRRIVQRSPVRECCMTKNTMLGSISNPTQVNLAG